MTKGARRPAFRQIFGRDRAGGEQLAERRNTVRQALPFLLGNDDDRSPARAGNALRSLFERIVKQLPKLPPRLLSLPAPHKSSCTACTESGPLPVPVN